jgi:hypothetical protein
MGADDMVEYQQITSQVGRDKTKGLKMTSLQVKSITKDTQLNMKF